MRCDLPLSKTEAAWRRAHVERKLPSSAYAHGRVRGSALRALNRTAVPNAVHGFDVSSYQPAGADFRQGGRQFAIWKATEGTGYFDPHFLANRDRAAAQGLIFRGMYHFARPARNSAAAEARWFLAHVGPRRDRECAVLDYETPPWSVAWVGEWIRTVSAAGWPVEFYSYLGMLSSNPTAGIPETGCGLWVAAYGTREPGSDRWARKDLWQHTDGQASVPGNDGPWDCSVADASVLVARVGGSSPVPPGPPPVPRPRFPSRVPLLAD